ncbi:MAG: hypothetical protein ACPGUV_06265, partial [Polyangiales bacterium]
GVVATLLGNPVLAATGPKGRIYSVDAQGHSKVFYQSEARHIMSLAQDEKGELFAGTDGKALLLGIDRAGQARVVHDFPGNEISAIASRDGELAVAVGRFQAPPRVSAKASQRSNASSAGAKVRKGKGSVWRIDADGRPAQLLEDKKTHFAALDFTPEGAIVAGAGQQGRVWRIEPDGGAALWFDVDERQITALSLRGPVPVLLTGDAAAVYQILPQGAVTGTWTSPVLDARWRAVWGRLHWRGQGDIRFSARSGSTDVPDAMWTDWSKPSRELSPQRVRQARFVQLRAHLQRSAKPVRLYGLEFYYRPQNQRLRLHAVQIQPGGGADKKSKDKMQGERLKAPGPSSQYKVRWKVDNPDGDALRYRLFARKLGRGRWLPLLPPQVVHTKTSYTWKTDTWPDGHYRLKVQASDVLEQSKAAALGGSAQSEPFLIDNHAPRLLPLRRRQGHIEGEVRDSHSPIASLAYAIDGRPWQAWDPVDGLFDAKRERFRIPLPAKLAAGEHVIVVRVTDAAGNRSSADLAFQASKSH